MDDFLKVWVALDKSVRAHQIRQSLNFYLRDCYSHFFLRSQIHQKMRLVK